MPSIVIGRASILASVRLMNTDGQVIVNAMPGDSIVVQVGRAIYQGIVIEITEDIVVIDV